MSTAQSSSSLEIINWWSCNCFFIILGSSIARRRRMVLVVNQDEGNGWNLMSPLVTEKPQRRAERDAEIMVVIKSIEQKTQRIGEVDDEEKKR